MSDYRATVLADDPLAYWRFEDAVGATVAIDEVGETNNGTYVGSPVRETGLLDRGAPGVGGNLPGIGITHGFCRLFDASDDRITTPLAVNPSLTDFSVELWLNRRSPSLDTLSVLTQLDGGGGTGRGWVQVESANSVDFFIVTFAGGGKLDSNFLILAGNDQQHHVVVTADKTAGIVRIYVDGVLRKSASKTIEASTGQWRIAQDKLAGNLFKGEIDEVAIYDHLLTAARVRAHYNAGAGIELVRLTATPVRTVQAAFGSNPTAASYTWTTIHEDGNLEHVRAMSYQRGRQNELNRMETGSGDLLVKDADSDWDSENTAGKWSPNVRTYVPIRAFITIGDTTYPLFLNYLERKPRTKRIRGVYTERQLTTVDGFEWLARAGLSGETYAQEASGTRIGNVLTDVSWPAALRDLDAGIDNIGALTVAADADTKALSHLLEVAEEAGENGLLFIDGQGRVRFVERHALSKNPYSVSRVTFRDAVSGGGGYPFVDAAPADDLDTTFNEWSGIRTGGTTQTALDTTSRDRYGLRSKQVTSLVTTDALVLAQMQWKLSQFKDPLERIASITVMPGTDTRFWEAVLDLEVGDRITVKETPPGWSTVKTDDYTIQHIRADFPEGPISGARFTFGLWPANMLIAVVHDDPVTGLHDSDASHIY